MFVTHSAAATNPGAEGLMCCDHEPMTGPNATPAFVAADSQPRLFARSLGAVASAT